MSSLFVIGMGPGNPDYILPVAFKTANKCDVLVGARRYLNLFDKPQGHLIELTGNLEPVLLSAETWYKQGKRVGFLVSGDPGIFSLLPLLKTRFPDNDIEVIPGISSVQYLFAKLKRSWHDCEVVSMHGRQDVDLLSKVRNTRLLAVLTDNSNTPSAIARSLVRAGLKDKRITVGSRLSWPGELIITGSPELISQVDFDGMCVVVIEDE
ncbi:MAG TPA: precorrin-6y C5,15-methyltransferase (decarboxylating) subunit CbiE [Syntrophothermus lipocalidus]|uniref:precorrin-6y C5,15-methyltransferase (decarboxylating) subunit CbiE n=1 Tax=Syntrophothermus lipocalidus TaxID=86170 RepID=UPI000310AEAA|nr:precorrin-6y C5,15-methyltransferase (decarboxylating) subunit CbiE [Syntrophothermus lipocalidus]HHV77101.1 precorrin-6y C5,15-methyltransferase (decarboxylating) subunit CbiE [Syntrophothermus lipocalidus]